MRSEDQKWQNKVEFISIFEKMSHRRRTTWVIFVFRIQNASLGYKKADCK